MNKFVQIPIFFMVVFTVLSVGYIVSSNFVNAQTPKQDGIELSKTSNERGETVIRQAQFSNGQWEIVTTVNGSEVSRSVVSQRELNVIERKEDRLEFDNLINEIKTNPSLNPDVRRLENLILQMVGE